MSTTHERLQEGIDLIKRAWDEPRLNYQSRFRPRIDDLAILPRIYQKPRPPIWVACFLTQDRGWLTWTSAALPPKQDR